MTESPEDGRKNGEIADSEKKLDILFSVSKERLNESVHRFQRYDQKTTHIFAIISVVIVVLGILADKFESITVGAQYWHIFVIQALSACILVSIAASVFHAVLGLRMSVRNEVDISSDLVFVFRSSHHEEALMKLTAAYMDAFDRTETAVTRKAGYVTGAIFFSTVAFLLTVIVLAVILLTKH